MRDGGCVSSNSRRGRVRYLSASGTPVAAGRCVKITGREKSEGEIRRDLDRRYVANKTQPTITRSLMLVCLEYSGDRRRVMSALEIYLPYVYASCLSWRPSSLLVAALVGTISRSIDLRYSYIFSTAIPLYRPRRVTIVDDNMTAEIYTLHKGTSSAHRIAGRVSRQLLL